MRIRKRLLLAFGLAAASPFIWWIVVTLLAKIAPVVPLIATGQIAIEQANFALRIEDAVVAILVGLISGLLTGWMAGRARYVDIFALWLVRFLALLVYSYISATEIESVPIELFLSSLMHRMVWVSEVAWVLGILLASKRGQLTSRSSDHPQTSVP